MFMSQMFMLIFPVESRYSDYSEITWTLHKTEVENGNRSPAWIHICYRYLNNFEFSTCTPAAFPPTGSYCTSWPEWKRFLWLPHTHTQLLCKCFDHVCMHCVKAGCANFTMEMFVFPNSRLVLAILSSHCMIILLSDILSFRVASSGN